MLRFDQCVCGTSTTGTGTLTLAATPVPPGGVDFDAWARATGIGFGNSAVLLVDYTIIEYTSTAFGTTHQVEGGTGTLTLGSSSGIANCTLARTVVDYTVTSMDSQPATPLVKPGTGITIATAANVLVMISPRSLSISAHGPYFDTSGDSNWGAWADGYDRITGLAAFASGFGNAVVRDWYIPFRWSVPMLVKRCTVRVQTFTTPGGTPVLAMRLYDINSSGQPGNLLYDFGTSATITATGNLASGASGNGFLLTPGDYFLDLCSSGMTTGTLILSAVGGATQASSLPGRLGASSGVQRSYATATGTAGAAPNPATLTSYTLVNNPLPIFGLSPT